MHCEYSRCLLRLGMAFLMCSKALCAGMISAGSAWRTSRRSRGTEIRHTTRTAYTGDAIREREDGGVDFVKVI